MLDTVRFIYEHGSEAWLWLATLIWTIAFAYLVTTWLRTTPEPASITIPDDITIRLEHHFFVLGEDNLPEEP